MALALWSTAGAISPGDLAIVERLAKEFVSAGTLLIHLVVGALPKDVIAPGADSALMQLFDPQGQVARLFALNTNGIILIDRNRRLVGIFAGFGPKEALTLCRANYEREPSGAVASQAPVLLIPEIFFPNEREALIDYWTHGEKEASNNLASSQHGNNYDGPQIKRRADVAIQSMQLFAMVKTRVERRVIPELMKAFQFTIDRMEMPRIGCYDSAVRGEFKRHRDNTTPYTAHPLSINLNDAYKGGEVVFPEYGRLLYKPAAGSGVAFSCSLLHEAQPVTSGRRFGLFTFFTDAEGRQREAEMLAKHGDNLKIYKPS